LQKWVLTKGTWTLAYDLVNGLTFVNNANANLATLNAPGVPGLLRLTGRVVGNQVQLFTTSYGLNELSQSYLYEITDDLGAMQIADVGGEQFATIYTDSTGLTFIRCVAFAPAVPEPDTYAMLIAGLGLMGFMVRRRKQATNASVR